MLASSGKIKISLAKFYGASINYLQHKKLCDQQLFPFAQAAQTFSKVRSRDQSNKFDNTVDAHLHGGVLGDPGPGCIHVNTSRHRLVDGYGREKYFHGVNVVVKGPPWIPRQDEFDPHWSFVKADMELLQAWGLNAIR